MGSNQSRWTPEQHDELLRMANQGFSASQIGEALGRSRNAVLGRCHREGIALQGLNQHTKADPVVITKRNTVKQKLMRMKTRPKFVWQDRIARIKAKPLRITFMEIQAGQCRYILGKTDGPSTLYCGLPAAEPHAYCLEHCRACFDLSRMRLGPPLRMAPVQQ